MTAPTPMFFFNKLKALKCFVEVSDGVAVFFTSIGYRTSFCSKRKSTSLWSVSRNSSKVVFPICFGYLKSKTGKDADKSSTTCFSDLPNIQLPYNPEYDSGIYEKRSKFIGKWFFDFTVLKLYQFLGFYGLKRVRGNLEILDIRVIIQRIFVRAGVCEELKQLPFSKSKPSLKTNRPYTTPEEVWVVRVVFVVTIGVRLRCANG